MAEYNSTPSRTCKLCGNEYPLTTEHWYRDKKAKYGLGYKCKRCAVESACARQRDNREAKSAYDREYRAKNIDKIKARYETNRERILEEKRSDRQLRPEVYRERDKAQYWRRPEYHLKRRQEYRKANYERTLEVSREWKRRHPDWESRHPETRRAKAARRRARKRNAPGKFDKRDIQALYARQDGRCWWCGKSVGDNYHVDHFIPLSRGGTNYPGNLVIACPKCNQSRGARLPDEWANRPNT